MIKIFSGRPGICLMSELILTELFSFPLNELSRFYKTIFSVNLL